ncbi:MAG: UPF0102 protein [Pirellulaceae bacterium]|nr:MAG: UPF0102 protein [Pirellulaceae bacterium]
MHRLLSQLGRWIRSSGLFSWRYRITADPETNLGLAGEQAAIRYLARQGYRIVVHSHRQKRSEIDIIALDGNQLVFIEVKTWRSDRVADPSAAVDRQKQARLTRAALAYMKRHHLLHHRARFDVISVVWPLGGREPRIRHYSHAFEAVGNGQFFC